MSDTSLDKTLSGDNSTAKNNQKEKAGIDEETLGVIKALARFPVEVSGVTNDLLIGLKEAFEEMEPEEEKLLKEFFVGLGRFTMLRYYFSMEQTILSARPENIEVLRALTAMRVELFGDRKYEISEEGRDFGAKMTEQEPMLNHFSTFLVERVQAIAKMLSEQAFLNFSSLDEFNSKINTCLEV